MPFKSLREFVDLLSQVKVSNQELYRLGQLTLVQTWGKQVVAFFPAYQRMRNN